MTRDDRALWQQLYAAAFVVALCRFDFESDEQAHESAEKIADRGLAQFRKARDRVRRFGTNDA